MKDLINPKTGEIIDKPTLQDVLDVKLAINAKKRELKDIEEMSKYLSRQILKKNKTYRHEGYTIRAFDTDRLSYDVEALRESNPELLAKIVEAGAISIKSGVLRDLIKEWFEAGEITREDMQALTKVCKVTTSYQVRAQEERNV